MKRTTPVILNKEKIIFLLVAVVFSGSLYAVFASRPVTLVPNNPMAPLKTPNDVRVANTDELRRESDYLQGKRNDPFADPNRRWFPPLELLEQADTAGKIKIPDPPRDKDKVAAGETMKKPFNPEDLGLEYIGIVLIDGKSCALLRTKNSPTPQRLMAGEKISGMNFSVTKVDLQAIWVSDGTSTGELRNERFALPPKPAMKSKDPRTSVFF